MTHDHDSSRAFRALFRTHRADAGGHQEFIDRHVSVRFGAVRCGSRERSACVGARDVFLKIPTILVTNIHVAHVGFVKSARVRIELNCARRRPGWTPFVGR